MVRVWVCSLVVASSTSNGLPDLFNSISSFFQALAATVVSLLIVALVALIAALAWCIWQQRRVSKLVIDPFINGTGNAELAKMLPGLNQLMRETLTETLHRMLDHVYHDRQLKWERSSFRSYSVPQTICTVPFSNLLSHSIDRYPLPEAATASRLSDLLVSLKAGSNGQPSTAIQFLRTFRAERGTRIITTLQSRVGDVRDISVPAGTPVPGLSFEILDVQEKLPAQLYTFWEPANATPSRPLAAATSPTSTLSAPSAQATGSLEQLTNTPASGSIGKRKKTAEIITVQPTPATNTTQETHYFALLQCAAQWLAIEIAREALLADENRHWSMPSVFSSHFKQSTVPASQVDRSRLANFTGYFHRTAALARSQFPVFYLLATRDFEQAITLDEQWYQPRENLADTYVMQALETIVQRLPGQEERWGIGERPGSKAKVYLYKALARYDEALQLLDQQERLHASPTQTEQPGKGPWRKIERRVQLGKSIALLLTGDEENTKRSMRGLKYLRSTQWNLEEERDSRLLYNLACWYALADRWQLDVPEMLALPDENAKQAACRYLIYCLARDSNLWHVASGDPCFSNLFPIASAAENWDRLLLTLTQKDYEVRATSRSQRDLLMLKGKDFEEAVLTIRQRVWGDEQI